MNLLIINIFSGTETESVEKTMTERRTACKTLHTNKKTRNSCGDPQLSVCGWGRRAGISTATPNAITLYSSYVLLYLNDYTLYIHNTYYTVGTHLL